MFSEKKAAKGHARAGSSSMGKSRTGGTGRSRSGNAKRGKGASNRRSTGHFSGHLAGGSVSRSRKPSVRKGNLTRGKELRKVAGSVFADSLLPEQMESDFVQGHRLQKVLAAAGYGSRRKCEELITTGRVEIDDQTVTVLGTRVFPDKQKIRVDGELLPKTRPTYLAINKPKGYLCTHRDQQGRRRVIDLVPEQYGRLFPVGRLDQNSEGLLILTNDGALAERLTHPRFEVPKKYRVQVAGLIDPDIVEQLQKGIHIAEGVVQADEVVIRSRYKLSSILEITLKEGKNREIRRMLARVGHKVMQLERVAVGPIKLGKLLPGEFRRLSNQEVAMLYRAAQIREKPDFV